MCFVGICYFLIGIWGYGELGVRGVFLSLWFKIFFIKFIDFGNDYFFFFLDVGVFEGEKEGVCDVEVMFWCLEIEK